MTPTPKDLIVFFSISLIALFCYTVLHKSHAKRSTIRKGIYENLYGPTMLSLILYFCLLITVFPIPLSFSFADCAVFVLVGPILFIQCIWVAMTGRLFFFEKHVASVQTYNPNRGKIAVILPTYKEPFQIAKMTLDSLIRLEYEGELMIIVVDNSECDEETIKWKSYVESYKDFFINNSSSKEVLWISRDPMLKGYKPLNLDTVYKEIIAHDQSVEYIMYVDADSTFTSDTLDQVIPAFESDSQLGYVQMMTVANNIKVNALSRAVGIQQTVQRFVLGEFGNWGIPIFYGHNAIFRRKVIDDLGGFLELDTQGNFMLTEDFSATISTYLNGYYGKTHWMYTSEGVPTSLKALKSMWHRWTFGAWQVLFKQFGKITRSKELTIFERISFFSFGLSYIANAFVPLFILLSFFSPAFFVLPIAIPAFTSLLSIVGFELKFKGLINEASKLERIKIYYQAFFMIPTYIVWVTLQASLEFFIQYFFNKTPSKIRKHLSRSGLEWVVTSKGNEREESFMFILKKHVDVFIFALLSLSIGISCFFRNGIYDNLLIVLPGAFFIANLLGTIVLFGKQGRNEDETMLGKVQAKELENFVKQGAKHTGKTTVEKYQVAEQYS